MRGRYIYLRGSVWWFQFKWPTTSYPGFPSGKLERFSLDTSDEALAAAEAAKYAADRLHTLAVAKALMRTQVRATSIMAPQMAAGSTEHHDDGTYTMATEIHLIRMGVDEAGAPKIISTSPNVQVRVGEQRRVQWASPADIEVRDNALAYAKERRGSRAVPLDRYDGEQLIPIDRRKPLKAKPPQLTRDDEIISFWAEMKSPRREDVREAEKALAQLRKMFPGITLETTTFKQATALGRYFFRGFGDDPGPRNDPSTAEKKVRWLSTALREGRKMVPPVTVNSFEDVQVKPRDTDGYQPRERRLPFDDDDTKRLIEMIPRMKEQHQLLALLVASTGMRPSEAVSIQREHVTHGIRTVTIGGKTESSQRTIPLPQVVLPYLPKRIDGPLFGAPLGDAAALRRFNIKTSNALNGYVRGCGITDPNKVFYSFRHRAITLLTDRGCPVEINLDLCGHEEHEGVHRRYIRKGSIFPIEELAKWMERISEDFDRTALRS